MVAITRSVSGNEDEAHVFCSLCFFGEDVPTEKAVQIATEHETGLKHIIAEVLDEAFQATAEALRVERGY
jgi:hypothetical protein